MIFGCSIAPLWNGTVTLNWLTVYSMAILRAKEFDTGDADADRTTQRSVDID
jgi:hypothetical protein